tara:strand:- start:232 stop:435 length:204 start_codon:yes stop_codon:yes gene_type:complete
MAASPRSGAGSASDQGKPCVTTLIKEGGTSSFSKPSFKVSQQNHLYQRQAFTAPGALIWGGPMKEPN